MIFNGSSVEVVVVKWFLFNLKAMICAESFAQELRVLAL